MSSPSFDRVVEHERPHRLAPRTGVREPAKDKRDCEVQDEKAERDRDERHEGAPELEQAGCAEHFERSRARPRERGFRRGNQTPGDTPVAAHDDQQQEGGHGERQERQHGGPQQRGRLRASNASASARRKTATARSVASSSVSPDASSTSSGVSTITARGPTVMARLPSIARTSTGPSMRWFTKSSRAARPPPRARTAAAQHAGAKHGNRPVAEHHGGALAGGLDADRRGEGLRCRRRRGLLSDCGLPCAAHAPGQGWANRVAKVAMTRSSRAVPPRRSIVTE